MKAIRGRTRRWWRTLRWRMYRTENALLSLIYFRWLRGRTEAPTPKPWNAPSTRAWAGLSEMVWTRLCGHGWVYSAKHGGIYWGIYAFDNQLRGDRLPGWHWPRRATLAKGVKR